MSTAYDCPHCGHQGSTSQTIPPGRKVRCPQCKNIFVAIPLPVAHPVSSDGDGYSVLPPVNQDSSSTPDSDASVVTAYVPPSGNGSPPIPVSTPAVVRRGFPWPRRRGGCPLRYKALEVVGWIWIFLAVAQFVIS